MANEEMPNDEFLALLAIYGGKSSEEAFTQQGMPSRRRAVLLSEWRAKGWYWWDDEGAGRLTREGKQLAQVLMQGSRILEAVNPATVAG